MRFEIYRGKDGGWYVHLVSANGQVLLVSEGYYSKWNAKRSVRKFPIPVVVL